MASRYDKYDPISGGFRAALDLDVLAANVGIPIGVGLTATGRIVVGAGNTGILGVFVADKVKFASDVVDVMTDGEIVDLTSISPGAVVAPIAGTTYFVNTVTGVLEVAAPLAGVNKVKVGHTVEAARLVVRVRKEQG